MLQSAGKAAQFMWYGVWLARSTTRSRVPGLGCYRVLGLGFFAYGIYVWVWDLESTRRVWVWRCRVPGLGDVESQSTWQAKKEQPTEVKDDDMEVSGKILRF